MRKRILPLAAGALLGVGLSPFAFRYALAWGIFPSRELSRASDYVRSVMQIVNRNYVDADEVGYPDLARNAIHGLVETLDPHSEYLESKDNAELEEDLSGEFGGIGVRVEMRGGRVAVISTTADSPSERAGIRRGDQLLAIDGRSLDGAAPMDDAVDRLRGKPGTLVRLGLWRPSTGQSLDLTLRRELIKVNSVAEARVLEDGVGYIRLTDFSDHTGEQFDDALDGLLKKNIGALILDLRNNPGGLLDSAVDVAEPFFRKGELIVSTRGRRSADDVDYRAEAEGEPLDLPMAVLINSATASAAEIVTGALKDTGRAVVVGERSFGKGTVQSIIPLKDGEALRLTTARYFTPGGASINDTGIAPQIQVVLTEEEDDELQQQQVRSDIVDPREFKARFGFAPIPDRQLAAALDALKGVELLDAENAAGK